jgi:integrase
MLPRNRSSLRLREPRRLPRPLSQAEAAQLLGSFRSWRDRAIAGLMLYCGLRSGEVLALGIADVDVGGRWLLVTGKGSRERRVPLDADAPSETGSTRLFVVARGPSRGEPLTAAGLRTTFRYHRGLSGVGGGHPHALRHTFGTALEMGRIASDASFGTSREHAPPAAQRTALRCPRPARVPRGHGDQGLHGPPGSDATMMRLMPLRGVHHRCTCWHRDASGSRRLHRVHHRPRR